MKKILFCVAATSLVLSFLPVNAAEVIGGGSSEGGSKGKGDDRMLFGGKILYVQQCNDGPLFYVGPPRPGVFKIVPGSLIYAWWSITQNVWTLGYGRGSVVPCILGKFIMGFGFPVVMMGTSPAGGQQPGSNAGGGGSGGGGGGNGGNVRPTENTQMP